MLPGVGAQNNVRTEEVKASRDLSRTTEQGRSTAKMHSREFRHPEHLSLTISTPSQSRKGDRRDKKQRSLGLHPSVIEFYKLDEYNKLDAQKGEKKHYLPLPCFDLGIKNQTSISLDPFLAVFHIITTFVN